MSAPANPLAQWNNDGGDWQGLRQPQQAPRYREIARLVELYGVNGAVLDVGCGEGVLLDYLDLGKISQYTGLDPSATAVNHIVLRRAQDRVERTVVESYAAAPSSWNVIIMSEILYYLDDPIAVLKKYWYYVAPGGVIIISIFQKAELSDPVAILRKLQKSITHPRAPRSNRHCTQMVEDYLRGNPQIELESHYVDNKKGSPPWRFWVAQFKPERQASPPIPGNSDKTVASA
jgi:SAM-dependent methyltransferase